MLSRAVGNPIATSIWRQCCLASITQGLGKDSPRTTLDFCKRNGVTLRAYVLFSHPAWLRLSPPPPTRLPMQTRRRICIATRNGRSCLVMAPQQGTLRCRLPFVRRRPGAPEEREFVGAVSNTRPRRSPTVRVSLAHREWIFCSRRTQQWAALCASSSDQRLVYAIAMHAPMPARGKNFNLPRDTSQVYVDSGRASLREDGVRKSRAETLRTPARAKTAQFIRLETDRRRARTRAVMAGAAPVQRWAICRSAAARLAAEQP